MSSFYSKDNKTRYPYTFACDWIREAGLAYSRADASHWFDVKFGDDANEMIVKAADEYVDYYSRLEVLDAEKNRKQSSWRAHQYEKVAGDR